MQNATTPAMIASKAIGMTTARMIVSLSSEIRQEGTHCDLKKKKKKQRALTPVAIYGQFQLRSRKFYDY